MISFKNIPGNALQKELLLRQATEKQVSHAQLFVGPAGSAVLFAALAFAKFLLCENRGAEDSCGTCRSCKQFSNSGHPDFHLVIPTPAPTPSDNIDERLHITHAHKFMDVVRKNPYLSLDAWSKILSLENKQLIIPKNESSVLSKQMSLQSYQGANRVILVWLPELFNETSGNKLLKLIEEPPLGAIFLFVSHEMENILLTIRSRTQAIYFKAHTKEDVKTFLKETAQIPEDFAADLADAYEGNIAAALHAIEHSQTIQNLTNEFATWMRLCFKGDVIELLGFSEAIGSLGKYEILDFLYHTQELLSRGVLFDVDPTFANGLTKENSGFNFGKFSKHLNYINTPKIQELLEGACFDINQNANKKVLMLDVSLKMAKLIRQQPV
jgi:DNA polymerase-3 subunit delta'